MSALLPNTPHKGGGRDDGDLPEWVEREQIGIT